jgi:aspartate carbamoyltransferase catalytic subunit
MSMTMSHAPAHERSGIFHARALVNRGPEGLGNDRRHLLGLEYLDRAEILALLDDAEYDLAKLQRDRIPSHELAGVTILLAFFEDSTRTRIAFELAGRRLGAVVVSVTSGGLSLSKGESLVDTLRIFEKNGTDLVVVRHASSGVPEFLARHVGMGIVNAGDGTHEHPTQGLVDLMTLRQVWRGHFENRRIAIVGDIAHSRVARSAIAGLNKLGVKVTVAGPATLIPVGVEALGCTLAATADEALAGADAVMALRIQRERMERGLLPSFSEYAKSWGIDARRVALMKPDAVVMHPGPVNRGLELAVDVVDGPRSVVLKQVENGMGVRSAVLRRSARAIRERA